MSADIENIMAGLHAGAEVFIPNPNHRGHKSYSRDAAGELRVYEYDEGAGSERACTEAEIVQDLYESPGSFVEARQLGTRARLFAALLADDLAEARARLRELPPPDDGLRRRDLFEAMLTAPSAEPDPMRVWLLTKQTKGADVHNAIRSVIGGGATSQAAGRFGVRFFATLEAHLGRNEPPQGWRRHRAGYRAMAGDLDGALADLEWERARQAEDDPDRPALVAEIARVLDQRYLPAILAAPDDDAPRLVWADVLSERGDARGELIVVQCEEARLDEDDPRRETLNTRALQLVALHPAEWNVEYDDIYHRGFLDSVHMVWQEFHEKSKRVFARSPPIREIRFWFYGKSATPQPAEILSDPRLACITSLDFGPVCEPEIESPPAFVAELLERLDERLPQLTALAFNVGQLTPEQLERIAARPALTKLDLEGCDLYELAAPLRRARGLEDLNLASCGLSNDEVAVFEELIHLKRLDLRRTLLDAKGARVLAGLGLRRLLLSDSQVDDDGARALAKARALVGLDLDRSRIGNDGVVALADLALTSLAVGGNHFDASALDALASGRIASSLQRLRLEKSGPGVVRALRGLPRLWELDVRGCALEGDGDAVTALLDALPALRALWLGDNALGDEGLATLLAHPRFAELEMLHLDGNQLGPEAGALLARAPSLPRRLSLKENQLGDDGVRALATASALKGLVELHLEKNGITNEGARALVIDSPHLAKIATLLLGGNPVERFVRDQCWNKYPRRVIFLD